MTIEEKIQLYMDGIRAMYASVNVPFPLLQVTEDDLAEVERCLEVVLPNDLKELSPTCCGEYLVLVRQLPFRAEARGWNIVDVTLDFRKDMNLPHRYVVLSDFDEEVILMETQSDATMPTPISLYGEEMDKPYQEFSCYRDYFADCLDQQIRSSLKIDV